MNWWLWLLIEWVIAWVVAQSLLSERAPDATPRAVVQTTLAIGGIQSLVFQVLVAYPIFKVGRAPFPTIGFHILVGLIPLALRAIVCAVVWWAAVGVVIDRQFKLGYVWTYETTNQTCIASLLLLLLLRSLWLQLGAS